MPVIRVLLFTVVIYLWGGFFLLEAGLAAVVLDNGRTGESISLFSNFRAKQILPQDVTYFKEVPFQPIDIEDLVDGMDQVDWKKVEKKSINLGRSDTPVWARFDVQNSTVDALHQILQIRWINMAKVDFYQVFDDKRWIHFQSGLDVPAVQQFRNDRAILFPILLKEKAHSTIYIRIETSYLVFLPMFIWQEKNLEKYESAYYVWYSLGFGIFIAMMLYNASLYVFTRDPVFFYYSVYVLGVIFYELAYTGIGPAYVWNHSEWAKLNFFALSIYISFISAAMYARIFLDLKSYGGWPYYFNTCMIVYWILMTITLLLYGDTWLRNSSEHVAVLSLFGALVIGVYLWYKKNISARYYSIAWGALVVFNIIAIWVFEGLLPYTFLIEYGQMFGFLLEVLLLSFAMAERINRERKEREFAQEIALDLQVQISEEVEAKVQAQSDVLKIQRKTNIDLERRVSERTAELEETLHKLEGANKELATLSVTDPLTNVFNRRYFDEFFLLELQRGERTQNPVSLILIDIDHFKKFNDDYGHLVGDDCLRLVSNSLQNSVSRENCFLARFGGEEFGIITSGMEEKEAMIFAEKIRKEISDLRFIYNGKRILISASLGIAGLIPSKATTPEMMISAADKALYQAKDNGRNCSVAANF